MKENWIYLTHRNNWFGVSISVEEMYKNMWPTSKVIVLLIKPIVLFCFVCVLTFFSSSSRCWVFEVPKGGFLLSRDFHVRTQVNFTRLNKIEAMFRRSSIIVKVESRPTHVYVRPFIHCLYYIFARKIYGVKFRDSGNLPQLPNFKPRGAGLRPFILE